MKRNLHTLHLDIKFDVTKTVPLGHYCGMFGMYYGMAQYGLFHQGMQQQQQARWG